MSRFPLLSDSFLRRKVFWIRTSLTEVSRTITAFASASHRWSERSEKKQTEERLLAKSYSYIDR